MTKFLFISGSPRRGNTDFILNRIFESIEGKKELVLLREKDIKHCLGCLSCEHFQQCAIHDDMHKLHQKMTEADVFVLGSPNYFGNVSGILKDFMDRTTPFYKTNRLKGKKLITILVGAGKAAASRQSAEQALNYFAKCHCLNLAGSYYFRGTRPEDVAKNAESLELIQQIIKRISLFS